MTAEEIFNLLAQHMIKGLMIHSQMADYFNFLGLKGFKECHEYHYFEENINYKRLVNYFIEHYNKLIVDLPFENPQIIPKDWFKYNRFDVNTSIRKSSIQAGFDRWIEWEQETKDLLQKSHEELVSLNEIASAIEIERYIKDVDEELAGAQEISLNLKSRDYNMSDIMDMQEEFYNKYKKKMKELKV
jgi:hypothetical protein